MKTKLTLILFLLCLNIFAQRHKSDTKPKQKDSVPKVTAKNPQVDIKKTDTVLVIKHDSPSLAAPNKETAAPAVVHSDTEKDGWFVKYIYPIILLLAGAAIPLFWEAWSERKRIKKVGERWTSEIRFLETPIKNQVDAIQKYLSVHNQQNLTMPDFQIFEGLDCEIFMSLDKSQLLKFLERHKTKNYQMAVKQSNYINGFISVVKSSNTNLKFKFKEYLDAVSNYTTEVTKNLTALSRAVGNYSVLLELELGGDPGNDPRLIAILKLFDAEIEPFRQTGNFELYKLRDNFLMPFLDILGQLRLELRTDKMQEYVGNCIDAIKGIKMEKQYLKENFETIGARYMENLEELPEVVKLVERRK